MADFLDEKRNEIAARIKELKPLVDEYERLLNAAAALDAVAAAPAATRGRRGRPTGSGKRGDEALALVKATPGITIPEIAQQMGIRQNYLYRVLPALAGAGLVYKDGRGWKPREAM